MLTDTRGAVPAFVSRLERFERVDSTQSVVRAWLADGVDEVCVAVADEQSEGRGRLDGVHPHRELGIDALDAHRRVVGVCQSIDRDSAAGGPESESLPIRRLVDHVEGKLVL